jgi:hypothetical protein
MKHAPFHCKYYDVGFAKLMVLDANEIARDMRGINPHRESLQTLIIISGITHHYASTYSFGGSSFLLL